MFKFFVVILMTLSLLCGQTMHFKEGKYIEAIDTYTYRDANISYDENATIIQYQDGKTLIKKDNNLTIYDDTHTILTAINLVERPEIGLYFTLTRALFLKDFNQLEENFTLKKLKNNRYRFTPKNEMRKAIIEMTLSLSKSDTIDSFMIRFSNGDRLKIEAK